MDSGAGTNKVTDTKVITPGELPLDPEYLEEQQVTFDNRPEQTFDNRPEHSKESSPGGTTNPTGGRPSKEASWHHASSAFLGSK